MKTKISDILINALIYSVYMILSCVVVMFAAMLAEKVVNLFVVVDNYTLCVMRLVIYTLGINALLGAACCREGFKAAVATPISTAISATLATLVHFVFALLFNFGAFASGGVRSMAILSEFGRAINNEHFNGSLDRHDIVIYFFINSLIYIGVMLTLNFIGAKLRTRRKKQLGVDH